jgi:S1-C subfamily serine protease
MRFKLLLVPAAVTLLSWAAVAGAQDLRKLFQQVSPSVVVIRAGGQEVTSTGTTRFTETGSGVLISPDGKVMTAAHVVHSMSEINVQFLGGDAVTAKVVASEPAADLSLLQLERVPPGARVARMADSNTVQVGEQVVIVGAPYGLSYSLSAGWISARWAPNTVYKSMPLAEFLQTNATINSGNSGGPMFNLAGEVIGLVSHNISKGGGSEGLGFVVTINTAKQLLLEKKSFWGGLDGQLLTNSLADLLNVPNNQNGYLIKSVAKGSPADAWGLRGGTTFATIGGEEVVLGGDIVLAVDGVQAGSLANMVKIKDAASVAKSGTPLKITILRAGRILDLTVKLP